MAVKIRLRRVGRKKAPMYRIVVADSRSPRDGKFIEIVGQYAPRSGDLALNLQTERVNYWLNNGAQPSDTVRSLLRKAGVLKQRHEERLGRKLTAAAIPLDESGPPAGSTVVPITESADDTAPGDASPGDVSPGDGQA